MVRNPPGSPGPIMALFSPAKKKIEIRFAIWSDVHTVLQPWAIDDYTSVVILINLCGRLSRHLRCQCRLHGFGYWKYRSLVFGTRVEDLDVELLFRAG